MRRLFHVVALSTGLFLASASAAQAPYASNQRNDFCYTECQYRCYAVYPGGGAAWQQCYLACARDKCGYVG
ncbi:hypothetical protein [Brevundimonas sp.]|uniref:hypothetical protein n=1 Tax=Brevundimonas sp. TaxID=1871086 RepID=UPI002C324D0A|nr:hypothetical protein [Brevundimonas sp.]HWQ86859.1 hypothetical protein [Brevundimonas sp.]